MQHFKILFPVLLLLMATAATAQTKNTAPFNKVIISPYIQVTFVQGNKESVTINDIDVDANKLHIEVTDNTLRIYLEGAKDFPKNEKDYSNGYKETYPLYNKTSVVATVTYKTLEALSIRGEENIVCEGPVNGDKFTLKIYGEPNVAFNKMNLQKLSATLYGEGTLEIKTGAIKEQKYVCYGEGKINSLAIEGNTSNLTAYGMADFKLNISDRIKITAFGDAKLHYKGNPEIDKGLHFGDMLIDKMD
jgi:putative autotransporter adhesin-like protein